METEEPRKPPRPTVPAADGSLLIAQLAAGLWIFGVFARALRQVLGRGQGFLSFDFNILEGVLLLFWIGGVIGSILLARAAMHRIRRQGDDPRPGRGEAITAIVISTTTVVISLVGLIVLAVLPSLTR